MIDKEMAEEYAIENRESCMYNDTKGWETDHEAIKKAFLAGLKAARKEMWHDLKKNPDDLPEENQEVLVLFTLPDKSKNDVITAQFENNDFNFVDLQDVIAWCEIPTF